MNPMLSVFEDAALAAGKAILAIRKAGAHASYKADNSPVTEADQEAERIILSALGHFYPDIPVVAEEAVSSGTLPATGDRPFFLVDPLDGTREFIGGHDDFTVNIALIEGCGLWRGGERGL
jgi:3'(2'), 5'-bisphosphate nucleotidase